MINNEAGLQAHFVKNLAAVFDKTKPQDVDRKIFVEPPFKLFNIDGDFKHCIPDIVICSARKIIGIVELKYGPRGEPGYKKDLAKLCTMFAHRKEGIELKTERYLGPAEPEFFQFSRDLLLVYAAVYIGSSERWQEGVYKHLAGVENEDAKKSLFVLGAATAPDAHACCWSMTAGKRRPLRI
jgi:hypothetical protein